MAKNDSWMSQDIGQAPETQTANYGLLAQAQSTRGKIAESEGQQKAETIEFLGKAGVTAYQGYQYTESAKQAKETMDMLSSPNWLGNTAAERLMDKKRADALLETTDNVDMTWFNQIKNAAEQGVLSPERAQAQLASKMRERIAANPGAAATIRKAFEDYSGRGDWDALELRQAFKEDETAKAAKAAQLQWAKEQSKDLFVPIQGPDGKMAAMPVTPEMFLGAYTAQKGPVWSAILAKSSGDYAQQQIRQADAMEAHNKSIGIQTATPNIQRADATLQHQLNVLAIETSKLVLPSMSSTDVASSMAAFKNKTEQAFDQNIQALTAAQAKATTQHEIQVYQDTIKKVEERKRQFVSDITGNEGNYIRFSKFISESSKMSAEEKKTGLDYFSSVLRMGFSDQEQENLKSQAGRMAILSDKTMPDNHPKKQLARAMENSIQAAMSNNPALINSANQERERMAEIANKANSIIRHLNTPEQNVAADALAAQNAAEAEKTKDAVSAINSSATVARNDAAKGVADKKKVDTSDSTVNLLVADSQVFSDDAKGLSSIIAAYKTGAIDATLTTRKEEYNKNTANRAATWLSSEGKEYYPSRVNAVLNGNKLTVDSSGNVVLKNAATGDYSVQVMLNDTIKRVNMLAEIQSLASGKPKKDIAQQFVEQTNTLPAYDRSMGAQYGRANAELGRDIVKGVAAGLKVIPGYSELNDATATAINQIKGVISSITAPSQRETFLDAVKFVETGKGSGVDAVSEKGAYGPYQFMPAAMEDVNKLLANKMTKEDFNDPRKAREAASLYMGQISRTLNTDDPIVIAAAYNYGMGNVKKLIEKSPNGWVMQLPKETRDYISRIAKFVVSKNG